MTDPLSATVTPFAGLPVVPDVPPWCALEPDPSSVRIARQHTRVLLDGDDLGDNVELVVSELVTNAIIHAPHGQAPPAGSDMVLLGVQVEARWVLVGVRDPWPRAIPAVTVGELDEHGRGLQIVDELAYSRWTEIREAGKTVYALLVRPGVTLTSGELVRLHRS